MGGVDANPGLANNGGRGISSKTRSYMMKKSLKLAMAASVMASPALAGPTTLSNMENPLYMPAKKMFYSKLSNGVMLKVADSSDAHKAKGRDGNVEFPIIRIQEELGFGITDRWAVHGSVQYTHDDDISRTGLSAGRIGTTYRLLDQYKGFVWDLYGDLHLGGVGEMRGAYKISDITLVGGKLPVDANGVFDYDNYSNGMWGFHVGTRFGRVWNDRFTTSAFVEVLRTFGDDNNTIRVVGGNGQFDAITQAALGGAETPAIFLAALRIPSEVSVDLKSTTEVNAGLNAFYQWSNRWSTGAWFKYNHHADQGVEKITTALPADAMVQKLASLIEQKLSNMEDGFDEYILGLSAAYQFTDHAQVALYGEYTFDTAHKKSQNGTDVKTEMGVRVNFRF